MCPATAILPAIQMWHFKGPLCKNLMQQAPDQTKVINSENDLIVALT